MSQYIILPLHYYITLAAAKDGASVGGGKIAVYGDSNCLDSAHMKTSKEKEWEIKMERKGKKIKLQSTSLNRNLVNLVTRLLQSCDKVFIIRLQQSWIPINQVPIKWSWLHYVKLHYIIAL